MWWYFYLCFAITAIRKKFAFCQKKGQEDNLSTQSSQCKYLWLNHISLSVFLYSKFFSCNNKKSMLHFLSLNSLFACFYRLVLSIVLLSLPNRYVGLHIAIY